MPRLRSQKNEIWKPIPGYEDLYLISSHGRVASIEPRRERSLDWAGRPHCRYRSVKLYRDGKYRHLVLHRLVYLAFYGEIPFGMQVDHKDHDRLNNHYTNLQLTTHEENQARRRKYINPEAQAVRDELFEKLGINI